MGEEAARVAAVAEAEDSEVVVVEAAPEGAGSVEVELAEVAGSAGAA